MSVETQSFHREIVSGGAEASVPSPVLVVGETGVTLRTPDPISYPGARGREQQSQSKARKSFTDPKSMRFMPKSFDEVSLLAPRRLSRIEGSRQQRASQAQAWIQPSPTIRVTLKFLPKPSSPHQTTEGNLKRESEHTRITATFY